MKMLGKCILLLMSCQLGVQLVMIKLTKLTLKAAVPLSYARGMATDQDVLSCYFVCLKIVMVSSADQLIFLTV